MSGPSAPPSPDPAVLRTLAPNDVLRVGINLSNFLLVSETGADGGPVGVSPSLAASLAGAIGVPLVRMAYPEPGDVVEAVASGAVDVGNVGADPLRAEHVAFTRPYCEIEATYLVPPGSTIDDVDGVDASGVRVVSKAGAAYTLWLERNIERAEVVQTNTIEQSYQMFVADRLEVLAGLRPRLIEEADQLPGSRVLPGRFTAVQHAIGVRRDRGPEAHAYLDRFVEWAVGSGLVARFIDNFQVRGLTVPIPPTA
jgi:polar amino acid transport system substrate-binding protein